MVDFLHVTQHYWIMSIFGNKKQTIQTYYRTLNIFLIMLSHMQKVSHFWAQRKKNAKCHFSSMMTLNNWKMITETRSCIFRWRSCCHRRRVCLSSLIDHWGLQNVVRTSVTHSAAPCEPLFCSILTSSVIYYSTDAGQHGIYLLFANLFVLHNKIYRKKKPFYFKFHHFDRHRYKNTTLPMKIKWTDWLLCLAKNCDWFKESRNCQTWSECCCHLCVSPPLDHKWEPTRLHA